MLLVLFIPDKNKWYKVITKKNYYMLIFCLPVFIFNNFGLDNRYTNKYWSIIIDIMKAETCTNFLTKYHYSLLALCYYWIFFLKIAMIKFCFFKTCLCCSLNGTAHNSVRLKDTITFCVHCNESKFELLITKVPHQVHHKFY